MLDATADVEGESWACRACTLSNILAASRCVACGSRRPATAMPQLGPDSIEEAWTPASSIEEDSEPEADADAGDSEPEVDGGGGDGADGSDDAADDEPVMELQAQAVAPPTVSRKRSRQERSHQERSLPASSGDGAAARASKLKRAGKLKQRAAVDAEEAATGRVATTTETTTTVTTTTTDGTVTTTTETTTRITTHETSGRVDVPAPPPPKAKVPKPRVDVPAPPPPISEADRLLPVHAEGQYICRADSKGRAHSITCAACRLTRPAQEPLRAIHCLTTRSRFKPHCNSSACIRLARGVAVGGLTAPDHLVATYNEPPAHMVTMTSEQVAAAAAAEGLTLEQAKRDGANVTGYVGVREHLSREFDGTPCIKYQAVCRMRNFGAIQQGPSCRMHLGLYPTAEQAALAIARLRAKEERESAPPAAALATESEAETLARRVRHEIKVDVRLGGLNAIRALLLLRDEPERLQKDALARFHACKTKLWEYHRYLQLLGVTTRTS